MAGRIDPRMQSKYREDINRFYKLRYEYHALQNDEDDARRRIENAFRKAVDPLWRLIRYRSQLYGLYNSQWTDRPVAEQEKSLKQIQGILKQANELLRTRNPMYPQEWTRALAVQKALDAYSGGKTLLPNGGNISPRTNRGTISAINAVQNRYQKALTEITDKKLLAAITTAEKDRAAAQAKTKKAKADYDKAEKYMEDTYKSKEKRLKERDEALRKAEEAKKKAKEPKHEMVLWRERWFPHDLSQQIELYDPEKHKGKKWEWIIVKRRDHVKRYRKVFAQELKRYTGPM